MLNKHKNSIYNLLHNLKFDPNLFKLEVSDQPEGIKNIKVKIRGTALCFIFIRSGNSFFNYKYRKVEYSPQFPLSNIYPINGYRKFEEILKLFEKWVLEDIQEYWKEIESPDFWVEFEGISPEFLTNEVLSTEDFFLDTEKEIIVDKLKTIEDYCVNELRLTNVQTQLLNRKVDYLIEKLENQNRIDWYNIALGTFFSFLLNLYVDTDVKMDIWRVVLSLFESISKMISS